MRRSMFIGTNNSASRAIMVCGDQVNETGRMTLTFDPGVYAEMMPKPSCMNNIENVETEKLDSIIRAVSSDKAFLEKYNYSSLFLIGAGSYGYVFRAVSNASGSLDKTLYREDYVRYLQTVRRTKSRRKLGLLDNSRDSLCLDLVAIKIEALTPDDVSFKASTQIQLVKEFCMLTELFRNQANTNNLVGFPLPIEFGYLGNQKMAKDLRKILIFDKQGRPSNYYDSFLGANSILDVSKNDVTYFSYFAMELVGPNLDEWKSFFQTVKRKEKVVFSVQTTLKLMDQVLCRLIVMHQKNIVHLDIKPDNICMGIGKMTNTVYLMDYGLSKICCDEKPTITMGSRRYMSVGVTNFWQANFMMDIESWFYVLVVLLADFVPWSDDLLAGNELNGAYSGTQEEKIVLVSQLKKKFWDDNGNGDTKLINKTMNHIESLHQADVPDIGSIMWDIYAHVKRMRTDFYRVPSLRMHSDIRNEESDLYKRYHTLRKLLLFPYDCDFSERGGCFYRDKDLITKQEKRRRLNYDMLIFAEQGQNWQWDWDVWFDEEYCQDRVQQANLKVHQSNSSTHNARKNSSQANNDENEDDEEEYEEEDTSSEPAGIPDWMKHYLARILGSTEAASSAPSESSSHHHLEMNGVLVA